MPSAMATPAAAMHRDAFLYEYSSTTSDAMHISCFGYSNESPLTHIKPFPHVIHESQHPQHSESTGFIRIQMVRVLAKLHAYHGLHWPSANTIHPISFGGCTRQCPVSDFVHSHMHWTFQSSIGCATIVYGSLVSRVRHPVGTCMSVVPLECHAGAWVHHLLRLLQDESMKSHLWVTTGRRVSRTRWSTLLGCE